MLNHKEKALMKVIYENSRKKGLCLLTPEGILTQIPYKYEIVDGELAGMMKALELEDYIEVTESFKKEKLVYCITLKKNGQAFERTEKARKKQLYFRIGLMIVLAVFSFVIKILLDVLF